MSQYTLPVSSTPAVPTTFTADSGSATPAANNINILGDDGLTTSGSGDTITIALDGTCDGSGTTVGATTADLCTIDAGGTAGCYTLQVQVVGFDSGTPSGASYVLTNGIRTTGAAAALTGTTDKTVNEEAAIATANADIVVSGNNIIVRVTGVAGLTINWVSRARYTSVT